MDQIFFFRLSVPCDEKSDRVKLEGFIAAWRTQLFSAGSFQFGCQDCGYVLLRFSCDCLVNGGDRHR